MPRATRLLISLLLLIAVGFAIGCATAPAPSPDYTPEQRRIDRLLRGSYLPQYAERLERSALRVAGHPVDRKLADDERLRLRIEKELAPDAVVADIVRRVSASFDESAVAQLERFQESPAGRRLHDASDAPYSSLSQMGYRFFRGTSDVAPERVALCRKIDDFTLAGQTTADLYVRVYEALLRWYAARFPKSAEAHAAQGGIEKVVAREREVAKSYFHEHGVPFMVYAFSDISTPELEEYVALVESPAGRWYGNAVREALIQTIELRSQAIER